MLPALPPPSKKQKNSHGNHTETMGAADHCLYRHLWPPLAPSGAGPNLWCTFIGSLVMSPLTDSIETTAAVAAIVVGGSSGNSNSNSDAMAVATAMAKALEMTATMVKTAVAAAPE